MEKLVTVYMPTRERPDLAARAIESVLGQSREALELIVVDDGSSPGSVERLETRFSGEGRLRLVRQAGRKGAGAARNRAIELATGEYITGLDDDDAFASDRLARLVEAWETRNASGRYSALFTARRDGNRVSRAVPVVDFDALLQGNYIGNQVFTLTARLKQVGGFDERLAALQDYEAWLRLTRRFGPALGLAEPTYLVDTGHSLGRISEKSVETLKAACEHIADAQRLTARQRRQLKAILFSYPQVPMSTMELFEQWWLGNYGQASRTWLAKKFGLQQ
jgi:glycosyltransferase involved in cell wall biosynthesis